MPPDPVDLLRQRGILVAEGLIRRLQLAGSPARFEVRVGDNHHHAICRVCGRTAEERTT